MICRDSDSRQPGHLGSPKKWPRRQVPLDPSCPKTVRAARHKGMVLTRCRGYVRFMCYYAIYAQNPMPMLLHFRSLRQMTASVRRSRSRLQPSTTARFVIRLQSKVQKNNTVLTFAMLGFRSWSLRMSGFTKRRPRTTQSLQRRWGAQSYWSCMMLDLKLDQNILFV